MHYVYILRSIKYPTQTYKGITKNLPQRLKMHNNGSSIHTNKFKPWFIETYIAFSDKNLAISFERYLKSASGRAFSNKRLIINP